ncbi:MAG: hypothetical protein ACI9ZT_001794 [Gammaproteobacteria bacterium]|jgi:hypothetical protein
MVEILAMQDAYMDVGGRQYLEQIVEQLQVHLSRLSLHSLTFLYAKTISTIPNTIIGNESTIPMVTQSNAR